MASGWGRPIQHDCGDDRNASAISGSTRCKIAPRHTNTTSNLRRFASQRSLVNLSKALKQIAPTTAITSTPTRTEMSSIAYFSPRLGDSTGSQHVRVKPRFEVSPHVDGDHSPQHCADRPSREAATDWALSAWAHKARGASGVDVAWIMDASMRWNATPVTAFCESLIDATPTCGARPCVFRAGR